MAKVKVLGFSMHNDYINLYTDVGDMRYRYQLQRGVVYNRLKPETLKKFMDDHNFEFNSKVYCLLGTKASLPGIHSGLELQSINTLRFHLTSIGLKVVALSQKRIRQIYADLSLGWRTKPLKSLIEMGFHTAFGKDKYMRVLKDKEYSHVDMVLLYIVNQPSLYLMEEEDDVEEA